MSLPEEAFPGAPFLISWHFQHLLFVLCPSFPLEDSPEDKNPGISCSVPDTHPRQETFQVVPKQYGVKVSE